MKRTLIVAVSSLFFFTSLVTAHPLRKSNETLKVVTLQLSDYHKQIQMLASMDFDIAGVDLEANTVDVVISKSEVEYLSIYYGLKTVNVVEIDPQFAPDPQYTTSEELTAFVQQLAADYPNIVRVRSIGKSTENRDIWAIKITDNPDIRETDEPAVLFNSMHHAREIMTTEIAMDTAQQLATGYGVDAEITNWVDSTEIWIVPMLNPDGNNKVWTSNSMWRKNTRGGYGVDLNRNYPYGWNSCRGSSGWTWSDTYRGPSAGSEPESQALMQLVAETEPVFDISYHSYSELVLYPFGCDGERTPTRDVVEGIGRQLASKLQRDSGNGTYTPGTAWELLYNADGGDIDWMYDTYNVIPYVIEVNASSLGFQPSYSYRQPTVEKMRAGWKFLMDRVHQSGVRGIVTDRSGNIESDTRVTIESLGQGSFDTVTWKVKNDGTYHLVLSPGMYNLRFELGTRAIEHEVTIGDNLTELDIQL